MAEPKRKGIMNHAELVQLTKEGSAPIDFDSLIKAGVLEKKGDWYKVLKMDELPSHAQVKIDVINSSKGDVLVKFRTPSKRLAKMLKPATPQEQPAVTDSGHPPDPRPDAGSVFFTRPPRAPRR